MSNNNHLSELRKMFESTDDKKQLIEKLDESFFDLDTTMNFKVNSLLKSEFENLCKKSQSNASREIKVFMLKAVKKGSLT